MRNYSAHLNPTPREIAALALEPAGQPLPEPWELADDLDDLIEAGITWIRATAPLLTLEIPV